LTRAFARFLHVEAAGGIVLLAATFAALVLANSPLAHGYHEFFETPAGFEVGAFTLRLSLHHWINDGLMALFFFVIGLEVKRELILGELRDLRRAALPIVGAIGGMVAPAGVYLALQAGEPGQHGWGIPMATDIAFVVGCMAVLGKRVPQGFRIMILSLAIADDIGAILVIAIGYTSSINLAALAGGCAGIGVVAVVSRLGVRSFGVYTVLGVLIWLAFHESGVHATIAGVILGLMTPARPWLSETTAGQLLERATTIIQGGGWEAETDRGTEVRRLRRISREVISPLEYLESRLHPWVGFVIMPVFALANAGIEIHVSDLGSPVSIAVMVGLVLGKPLGIFVASWLAVKSGLARLPDGVSWVVLLAGGILAGIGFTMALFIAGLALPPELQDQAKIGILTGSALAAVLGMLLLVNGLRRVGGPDAGPVD
jgi:NhaA family Na+:H+ antiporter